MKISKNKIRVNFVTVANPTNAYSGIQYISEELTRMGFDVRLHCRIPVEQMVATKSWSFAVFNVASTWYGNIRIIRTVFYWMHIIWLFLRGDRNFIFHEAHFFRLITLFKRLSRKTRCIHYATELYTEKDEPAHAGILEYYRQHASVPDAVVECDYQRKLYRKAEYQITTEMCVIPNTLPVDDSRSDGGGALKDMVDAKNVLGLPVLIYSGAGYLHRELDKIIDGVAQAKKSVFLVLVCYGPDAELDKVQQYAETHLDSRKFSFVKNATRDDIKRALSLANAGIVYYRPSLSIGNRFAAPTKFFEYVSAGLSVVSSHNDSLTPLIDEYKLGSYTDDETSGAIARAIDKVFEKNEDSDLSRVRIRKAFRENLSFEISAHDGMKKICEIFTAVKV